MTLIETLITIGLIIIIFSFTVFTNIDSFRSSSFAKERDTLISALEHARSEAISNICRGPSCTDGKPHGVAIRPADHPSSYVIFQTETGMAYGDRTAEDKNQDILLDSDTNMIIEVGSLTEVIFSQLSSNVSTPGNITVRDTNNHTSTITINGEGQILWTN